jgi:peptidoglycan/LPS O-acetylase OafA/YrhL
MAIPLLIFVTVAECALLGWAAARFRWITIPAPEKRVGCLDGLRGYLALTVFFHHFVIWLYVLNGKDWNSAHGNVHSNAGQASVAVFFMITGVLFYPKILRRLSDGEWLSHFVSRIFRLTPLMWFATAAVVAIVLYQNEFHVVSPPSAIAICLAQWLSFYRTPNLFGHAHTERIIAGVTWSLVYEWGFYLLLPGLSGMMCFLQSRVKPIVALLAAFLAFEWFIYRHYVGPRYYVLFVIGMLAAEIVKYPLAARVLRSRWAAAVGLAAIVSEFVFCPTAFAALPPVLLGLFFLPAVAGNSYFGLLSLRASIVLGEISYGIYLLHGILLYVILNSLTFPAGPYVMLLLGPIVVAVAMIAHRVVEVPAIAFGRRIGKRLQNFSLTSNWGAAKARLSSGASEPAA